MNTILVTGTATCTDIYVEYNVNIWASQQSEDIQFITQCTIKCTDYTAMWSNVKQIVNNYFDNPFFMDGAYTKYLNHLIKTNDKQKFHLKKK